ncbi:MAG: NAD(P)-binding domain-containing protein, partial [Firmicutes bacterium]|nr:NAD(P)-binding domain-containing protein [Bacillota bacterium]
MDKTVSFIGVGNMGGALLEGACKAVDPKQITITDYDLGKAKEAASRLGCNVCASNLEAAHADYVFLCVKPQVLGGVLEEIGPTLDGGQCLVSIAAGVTIASIRAYLPEGAKAASILRVMPNITAAVGRGMLALSADGSASDAQKSDVRATLSPCGRVDELPETLMDQFTAVAGCLPAWVFLFI